MLDTTLSQYLPNYTDYYKNDARFLRYDTLHYYFHYFADSIAEREIEQIAKRQEDAFQTIVSRFDLHPQTDKISYYLYPNAEMKEELMGDNGPAQSVYRDRSVHIIYNEDFKPLGEHEDTHILTLEWGVSIGLLQEGIAEYVSGDRLWSNKPLSYWMSDAVKSGIPARIGSCMSHQGWLDTPDEEAVLWYAVASSWTEYLLKNFGLPAFIKLYTSVSRTETAEYNISVFNKVIGKSFDDVVRDWEMEISMLK